MTYDTMSVRELFSLAFDTHYHCVDSGPSYGEWREGIKAAIRRKVIEEASVGTCYCGPGFGVIWKKLGAHDGEYDLIPKETP